MQEIRQSQCNTYCIFEMRECWIERTGFDSNATVKHIA
jgi:hypothetical protein